MVMVPSFKAVPELYFCLLMIYTILGRGHIVKRESLGIGIRVGTVTIIVVSPGNGPNVMEGTLITLKIKLIGYRLI